MSKIDDPRLGRLVAAFHAWTDTLPPELGKQLRHNMTAAVDARLFLIFWDAMQAEAKAPSDSDSDRLRGADDLCGWYEMTRPNGKSSHQFVLNRKHRDTYERSGWMIGNMINVGPDLLRKTI